MGRVWIAVCLGVAFAAGGAAGIAIGVKLSPELADRYILSLGDVGTWVGAFVTAVTAGIALWLSRRAEIRAAQSEVEALELKQSTWPGLIMLEIVSHGRLPAYVQRVYVVHKEYPGKIVDLAFYYGDGNGPVRKKLEHREVLQIPIMTRDADLAAEVYSRFEWQVRDGLSLVVKTSMQDHSGELFDLSNDVIDEIVHSFQLKRPELEGKDLPLEG